MNEILRSGSWLLALVGSAYAIWIILDCWRQTRTAGEASKARKSISRSDLLSQLVAALVLLVVVVPMLLLNDRSKAAGDPDKPEEDLSFVKIDGMRDLPRNRLHFASGWTGGTLEGADLADLPVSDDEVRALLNYGRRLQWLNLTGSEITDDVLSDLAAMRSLANLNLASTAITDEGLAALTSSKRLEELGLKETQVSDAGISHLLKMPRLKFLDVRQTGMTRDGLKALREAPRLREVLINRNRRNVRLRPKDL